MKLIPVLFLLTIIIFSFHELRGVNVLSNPANIVNLFSPSKGISPRIIGGNAIAPHTHKSLVRVISHRKDKKFFCGGTLLNSRCVVTAGHCVNTSLYLTVTMGIHNVSASDKEEPFRKTIKTNTFKLHDAYNESTAENDIALIMFENPINFNDYIQPINLPNATDTKQMYIGKRASAVGWGLADSGRVLKPSAVPREVSVLVMPNFLCMLKFGHYIRANNICTNGFSKKGRAVSTCNGDSGGPLVFKQTNTLIGVTSFGDLNCVSGSPSVFSDIIYFRPWLMSNIPN